MYSMSFDAYFLTSEDALMKANSDVTDALRRTIALMQTELERSVLSTQLLDESTATLRSTSLQHDTLHNVMSISKQLVTALEKSDWMDRVLILSGFIFFILVVLFILKQRIVDRGLRIAFWWTRFIPSFGDDSRLLQDAEKGMVSAVAEASSTVVAAAVTVSSAVASAAITSVSSLLPNSGAPSPSIAVESIDPTTYTPSEQAYPSLTPDDTPLSESTALPSEETSSPTTGAAEEESLSSTMQTSTEHIHIEL
jgi:protein transport protein SEC20